MRAGPAGWVGDVARFLAATPDGFVAAPLLAGALRSVRHRSDWTVALDLRLLRLGRRIDAVLATGRAVFAIQVRPEARAFTAADRLAAEDAALDLADFHPGCVGQAVIPVLLVPNGARPATQLPLALAGAAPVVEATRLGLPGLIAALAGDASLPWDPAGYAPVPALLEAACALYAGHGVEALRLAGAGPDGVTRTRATVSAAIERARNRGERWVVFVTGDPGAGKTLCGLNLAFGPGSEAAFLTGNPTLVHVLREALVRDAVSRDGDRRAMWRRVETMIQALPRFRDHYVATAAAPAERMVVIDEAQRCWTGTYAVGKTQNRPVTLHDSEPGHLLDIMGRREGWCVLVCLLGGGQEIHDGEGGLATWGEALAARPEWRALAPPHAMRASDPRQRLSPRPSVELAAALHLQGTIRAVARPHAAEWVDAVLRNDAGLAAEISRKGIPFAVTRSLHALRAAIWPRGTRTSGLVASSGARRLRAEGLGAALPHQDDEAVARWFLDRWPDVRSGDALEVTASEFAVQGLELDQVGLCWDADLVREGDRWAARRFRANQWTQLGPASASNRINAYRVLMTRARHRTVIWVPRGCPRDRTRNPRIYDQIANFLVACGAMPLDSTRVHREDDMHATEAALL